MNKEQLITKQQLEIEELKEKNKEMLDTIQFVVSRCYNVGGPLNDNRLEFNKEQRIFLKNMIDSLESFLQDDNY